MNWTQILVEALGCMGITSLALFLFGKKILEKALDAAIAKNLAEYKNELDTSLQNAQQMFDVAQNKFLKDYEYQLKVKDRAAGVAELLSVAFSNDYTPERFNRLAWDLSLWLPAKIVCDLSRCLCREKDAKKPQEILIEVRRIFLGESDMLTWDNIVYRPMNAFTIQQQNKVKELYDIVLGFRHALHAYYSAQLARIGQDSKDLFETMRQTHDAVGALETKLVDLINRNFELPKEIISAASDYHIALIEVFARIDQLGIGELVQFCEMEARLSKPTQTLREMLNAGFAAGMPIPDMEHLQQKSVGS